MSLRPRIALWFAMTSAAILAGLYLGFAPYMLRSYEALESEGVRRDLSRVRHAVDQLGADLDIITTDWAQWDDTYRYIEDRNKAYESSNLVASTLATMRIDLVMLLDTRFRPVRIFPVARLLGVPPPDASVLIREMATVAAVKAPRNETVGIQGLVRYGDRPVLISLRRILTSEAKGPARGWLAFARYVDADTVKGLAERTSLNLQSYAIGSAGVPPDCAQAARRLGGRASGLVLPVSTSDVRGYTVIPDIHGRPFLLMRLSQRRSIYLQGQASIAANVRSLTLAALAFVILTLLMIERFVTARIARLASQVERVSLDGNRSPVELDGRDELAWLAGKIESMVSALQETASRSHRLATVGTVAAGVAHELNQPIAVIRGTTQILLQDPDLGNASRQDLDIVIGQTDRMMHIIDHMKRFCRGGQSRLAATDVNVVIQDCLILIGTQLKSHGVDVTLDLAPELPPVMGDGFGIEQVLINLLTNARDALDGKEDAAITIRTSCADGWVLIDFADNGPGIPEDALDRIFDPFFSTKEQGKGTGLGLSISHDIVARHGGEIRAWNDGGARFGISLPAAATADQVEVAALAA